MVETTKQLRVALVGCGQIADAHLGELQKIRNAVTVGVCDSIPELAKQAARRFGVDEHFSDFKEMLVRVNPDVVHITTPPHTHTPIAKVCFQHCCHVYVEKPFSVDEADAKELLSAAADAKRHVCPGHDQLFDPFWLRLRRMIAAGQLGEIVHIDSVQGYDLSGPFGRVLAENAGHWVHRLPGGLLQNTIIHALYRVDDLLRQPAPTMLKYLSSFHDMAEFPTELRATLVYPQATANLLFTSAARPVRRTLRVLGTKGSVELDFDTNLLRHSARATLPGALGKVEAPFRDLWNSFGAATRNAWRFLRSDLQYFGGMRELFERFYGAIRGENEFPISDDDTIRLVQLTDQLLSSNDFCEPMADHSLEHVTR